MDKARALRQASATWKALQRVLRRADLFQFRAPTGMGVYLIPWLMHRHPGPGWYKYAGDWQARGAPATHTWQRHWLACRQRRPVTINGRWPGQPQHCHSFENPCLESSERQAGRQAVQRKDYIGRVKVCFVGRMEEAKGVLHLLEAMKELAGTSPIREWHWVGDGSLRKKVREAACRMKTQVTCHGILSRPALAAIYADCHLLVLPSSTEGFPKVVAEAANYGCLPVVTDVSCISQYVRNGYNGWLIPRQALGGGGLVQSLKGSLRQQSGWRDMAGYAHRTVAAFTYSHYHERIERLVLELVD
jgi:glycosyltransferase involved in cell wall biosynthesis